MPEPGDVTSFRLSQLEQGFKELRGDLKEAVGTLGGGMTALQTQLSSYQTTMGDRYVTRRDWESRNTRVDMEITELRDERGQSANRIWFAIAALSAAGSFIAALVGWFRPLH